MYDLKNYVCVLSLAIVLTTTLSLVEMNRRIKEHGRRPGDGRMIAFILVLGILGSTVAAYTSWALR